MRVSVLFLFIVVICGDGGFGFVEYYLPLPLFLLNRVGLRLHLPLRSTLLVPTVFCGCYPLVIVCVVHSCIAIAFAIAVSASDAAATVVASAISSVAPAANAASLARFANVAMTPVFCACCAAVASLAWSCLSASASVAAICLSSFLFALRSRCCCGSSSMNGRIRYPAKCFVKSMA